MRVRSVTVSLVAIGFLIAGCGDSGVPQEQLDALQRQLDEATSSGEQANTALADAQQGLTEAETRVGELEAVSQSATDRADMAEERAGSLEATLAEAEEALTAAEERLAEALDNAETAQRAADDSKRQLDELRLAYDPEIQAAREALAAQAVQLACDMATTAGADGSEVPTAAAVATMLETDAAGFDAADLIDAEEVEAELARCYGEAQAEAEALALQARLTEDKGSGFYTVGDEIASGRWRSTGTGDDCYWARLDADQEILDNHFGNAGGSVTIRPSDYEVEFSDCGTWEYLGP